MRIVSYFIKQSIKQNGERVMSTLTNNNINRIASLSTLATASPSSSHDFHFHTTSPSTSSMVSAVPSVSSTNSRFMTKQKQQIKKRSSMGNDNESLNNPFGPSLATGKISHMEDNYDTLEEIGAGRFGVVKRVLHKRSLKQYAAKQISKCRIESINEYKNEINVLSRLNHPNIAHLVDVVENRASLHIITELYTGGELYDKINKQGTFNEYDASKIMKQLLNALVYLHSNGVVHRDIKPENIVFSSNDDDARLVLVDFGLSGTFDPNAKEKGFLRLQCGVSLYFIYIYHIHPLPLWNSWYIL